MDIQLPPRLDLGSGQLNNYSVASAIDSHIVVIERDAKQKRDMVLAFAHSVNSFVALYTTIKERKLASELSQKVVTFLSASIYAETDSAASTPAHPCSNPSADIPAPTTKTVTYADRARSNTGLSSSIDPRKSRNNTVSMSSAAGKPSSSSVHTPSVRPTKSANTALSSNADRRNPGQV
ncbi:hypothetical protein DID88_001383 [Monilinia fructigena]|uniref:Uncharacterized protein n=1 Tax=Monilinia fructigena TaxID=38457 RepID=A0A395IXR5_9HELO|nr:hypothetical protein DID88_001383 [Monilinia fructigena]